MRKLVPVEPIEQRIFLIRGCRVMLDSHLAQLYGVKPFRLREQIKRNYSRFPDDFMFQLTAEEAEILVSQNAIPSSRHFGGFLPYVFTQEGVAMLSSVLRSGRAIEVNISIMRAFVRLRDLASAHKELSRKLEELERKFEGHDAEIGKIFRALRDLTDPVIEAKRQIGFNP
jgi:hypothetical protein